MKGLRLAALALIALPAVSAAQKTVIGTPTATLSPAIRVGDLVFLSGKLPARGADSTIESQTTSALESMNPVLAQAGTTKENIVKCTVFLVDVKDFAGM